MPTRIEKVFEGFTTEEDAELAGVGLRIEGYETSVEQAANGTFTLTAQKMVDEAANAVDDVFEDSDGEEDGGTSNANGISNLLDFIAKFESNGNYNAYYNNSGNTNNPRFTSMTVGNVRDWQENYVVVNGATSSAVGRYQIIRSTLDMLIDLMAISTSTVRFTKAVQDSMAIRLIERRGLERFLQGDKTRSEFGNSLAKEWAALPVLETTTRDGITIARGDSYYSGVAGNKALIDPENFENVLDALKT